MMDAQPGRLQCSVLRDAQALRRCRDELARLAESTGAASSIVQHPDWLLFELESRGPKALLHVILVTDEHGHIVGYAPFLAARATARVRFGRHALILYRGRTLRLMGQGVVAAPQMHDAIEHAVADALRHDATSRVIHIQETTLPNTLATQLGRGRHAFACVHWNLLAQVNWVVQPQASVAAYMESFSSKRRKQLNRRLRNMYSDKGSGAQLRIFDDEGDVDAYCRAMNRLYAKTWHASLQQIDWELPARMELFRQLARRQQWIGYMLFMEEQPFAYVHCYRVADRCLVDAIGYDEAFSRLGAGSVLVFQAVQDLIERHPGCLIDFGYGDNLYKRVLGTRSTPSGSLYLVRGVLPRLGLRMIGPLRMAFHGLRRLRGKLRKADPAE